MVKVAIATYGLQKWFGGDFAAVIDLMRQADEAGIDQVSITDHVVMGEHVENYPYGKFYNPIDFPWYEPIAVLSAIAAVTRTMRLSTGVLIAPLRPAVLLAKQIATLDVLSRGRVDIGLGLGWQKEEYDAAGIPWDGRYTRLEEQVRVCRALWADAPVSFAGKTVAFDGIHAYPRPVQPHVPVWFGVAPTDRNFQRIAELGDGWLPMEKDPEKLSVDIERLRAAFRAQGRSSDGITVRAVAPYVFRDDGLCDLDATLAGIPPMVAAGVTMIEFHPYWFGKGAEFGAMLEGFLSVK